MYHLNLLRQRMNTFSLILEFFENRKLAEEYSALNPVLQSLRKKLQKANGTLSQYWPGPQAPLKKLFRRRLANAAYHVSCGVYSYAQITGNTVLKNAVHYSFSD